MVEQIKLEDLQKIVYNYLAAQHHNRTEIDSWKEVNISNYSLRTISESPLGFLSQHHYLFIDLENGKRLRFFTKSAPIHVPARLTYVEQFGVFRKEMLVYRELLPLIETIAGSVSAKCFYTTDHLLVFEDLFAKGYRVVAQRDGLLDYQHLRSAVHLLAKFHASSIIWEEQNQQQLNESPHFAEILSENAYPRNVHREHVRECNFSMAVKVCQELIKMMPKYSKDLARIIEQLPQVMRRIFDLAQTSPHYRNVMSHGDLWANNIMFKEDKSDHPDCLFVDFQLARYSPPILDLITLLTIPTSSKFRQKHLKELIDFYYKVLMEFLAKGLSDRSDIERIFPLDKFEQSFREFRVCGLIESILFSHLTILPPALTQKLTQSTDGFEDFFQKRRIEICVKAFNTDPLYRERLTEMLQELIDHYILNQTELN